MLTRTLPRPGSSVSGLYIGHPEAYCFGLARIEADQAADYAARKGMDLAEVHRWLAPVLGKATPDKAGAAA